MTKFSSKDIISDLPRSINDLILTKLPIRDAVRTSVLSSKWRYQWRTMTELVFDDKSLCLRDDKKVAEKEFVDFIMRFLMLHNGPIQKFKLSASYLKKSTEIYQWLLVISRKDIKELVLNVPGHDWKRDNPGLSIPRIIFTFQKLNRLMLSAFTVKPPVEFQGYPCLKCLELDGVTVTLKVIENLISGCPLLEKFKFINMDKLALTIRAPNLKHLIVGGNFDDLYLEDTPLVVAISICFYPVWRGDILRKVPVTYDYLKSIEIRDMDYEDLDMVVYVLHLLLQSPNLQELQISADVEAPHYKHADFDIWERHCPADFTFKHLRTAKLSHVFNKNEMEFVKFVLGRSPLLKEISISFDEFGEALERVNEVLRLQRASPGVEINFFEGSFRDHY
ncbi:hypothetical protein DCAR_0729182 [Daucus carota subsp. sativus]|uniref:FBD domain-containing protein n=1 Tax=Daucus carota subsp. sativus TaxID=79200 RepID=A0AAF1B7Q5_DAUCS|nr:hypothetical protein DCAR_0729182 [Daucus carota subsp. sativus]